VAGRAAGAALTVEPTAALAVATRAALPELYTYVPPNPVLGTGGALWCVGALVGAAVAAAVGAVVAVAVAVFTGFGVLVGTAGTLVAVGGSAVAVAVAVLVGSGVGVMVGVFVVGRGGPGIGVKVAPGGGGGPAVLAAAETYDEGECIAPAATISPMVTGNARESVTRLFIQDSLR